MEDERFAETPVGDDVADPGPAKGEVRPGTVGGARPPRVEVVPDQLLVKFEDGTPRAVVDAVLARAGVAPERLIAKTGARVVAVPPEDRVAALAVLESSPSVAYAESDVVVRAFDTVPNDAYWPDQWGPRQVSAPRAWDATRGSQSAVIAVLDTGVDFGHPDLRGASVAGYDFVNNDPDPADDQGHGTAAAGVIAARTNNAEGVAGTCWTCPIMPVKVLDANGSGSTSTLARGIVWAADNGARVINMSLGGPGTTQTLADAVAYAADKGVLLVAAAGNAGTSTLSYPAAYPTVMGVAGTDSSDRRYSWSNYGAWVQVAAPGCNLAPLRGGTYGTFCGTSSATPVVAGLAGLARSVKPEATRDAVTQAIASTASPIGSEIKYGRVDAAGTLVALGAAMPPPAPPPATAPPPPPSTAPPPPPSTAPPPSTLAPTRTIATLRGAVTAGSPRKVYARAVASGRVVARLNFSGAPRLALSIVNRNGTTVRRVSGSSPLRATATVRAASYRFVVSARNVRRASFTLRVSHSAP